MNYLTDYIFSPLVISRTPVYSYDHYDRSGKVLGSLVKEPFFKSAILLASSSLYEKLQSLDFDYEQMNPKLKLALQKYYNRMCFRATPFGLFAGVSTLSWGEKQQIVLGPGLDPRILFSHERHRAAANKFVQSPLALHLSYEANHSLYVVKDQYRYLKYLDETESGKRTFYLNEVERTALLIAVIDYCRCRPSKMELVDFVSDYCDADKESSLDYIDQLIALQVINSLIPPDANHVACELQNGDWRNLHDTLQSRTKDDLSTLSKKSNFYVNLNRSVGSGQMEENFQEQIRKGIRAINCLQPAYIPDGLQNFKSAFKKKFDRQFIPLMLALDPELGVGYEKLAAIPVEAILLKDVSISSGSHNSKKRLNWSAQHQFLMQKWNQSDKKEIKISSEELAQLASSDEDVVYAPNSLSVLFRLVDDQVYIENAGGATAVALSARFTLFDEGIEKNCRFIAKQTATANPDVIFAEINHFCDSHTANIDRKKQIWEYEIPVLTTPIVAADKQILLTELFVGIENDLVILWSEKLGKIIIPVLSSAYNYLRNDLAVFRFLCELQHQQLKTNLSFELSQFFPELDYYPRVSHDGVIIHLATWHIKLNRPRVLKDLVSELELPQFISVTEHDNQLVFDTGSDADMDFLSQHVKNMKEITIKEFPFAGTGSMVTSPSGEKHIPQFITTLYHTQEVYKGANVHLQQHLLQRKFMPGSEWLYCKLYCHAARGNEILTGPVLDYITSLEKSSALKWFFVRYHDPAHHLRIRLQVREEEIGEILILLRNKFEKLITSGILSNFQVDLYERELERYGEGLIEDIEQWFCASSGLVMAYLQHSPDAATDLLNEAFLAIESLCRSFGFSIDERIDLFRNLYGGFSAEFNMFTIQNEQLKQKFREIKHNWLDRKLPAGMLLKRHERFEQECIAVHNKLMRLYPDKKEQLLIDMIHMHLNRLFTDEARKQEMIIYYCLAKHYQSVKARKSVGLSSVYS